MFGRGSPQRLCKGSKGHQPEEPQRPECVCSREGLLGVGQSLGGLSSHLNCSGCGMDDGVEEGQTGLRNLGRLRLESSRKMRSGAKTESAETMRSRWLRKIFRKQKSIEMGDGFDVVDDKDGVGDGS